MVCILADQEVGIDIQIHRKANYERMLKRMVPEDEYNEILASADMQERFFEQWVLRSNLPRAEKTRFYYRLFSPIRLPYRRVCRDFLIVDLGADELPASSVLNAFSSVVPDLSPW